MIKKLFSLCTCIIMSIALLTGCTSQDNKSNNESNKDETLKVTTSFYPVYLLTKEITKDIEGVEVTNLVSETTGCLHNYSLTTEDLKQIEESDVMIINGAGMETFIEDVTKDNEKVQVIDSSMGIELIEQLNHEHEHENHKHDHEEETHHHEVNSHIWLSPNNAIKQIENIANGLGKIDSKNEEKYKANCEEFKSELEKLNEDYKIGIGDVKNKNIVTFHEAFPYLAKEYNLNIASTVQREEGSEPSAKELQETIEIIKEKEIKTIFIEPQYPAKVAETISKETGATICILDPAVTNENNKTYIEIMYENLEALKEALK